MSKPSRRATRGTPRPGGPATGTAAGGTGTGRVAGTRAGRRERPRVGYARRPFWDRYRGPILGLAVVAAVAVIGAFAFTSATQKTYACSIIWEPSPGASADPSASPDLGYLQPDMGRQHNVSVPQRYTYCPPASGNHTNRSGQGPIEPRVYGPDDFAEPAGWLHNLEHGALVVLYRAKEGDPGPIDEIQDELRAFFSSFPNSPVCNLPPGTTGPIIARFDDMAWPYAAMVWGRVLPLDNLDLPLIQQFFLTEGERTNPEPQCAPPSASPAPSASPPAPAASGPAPSASPVASSPPAASGSPAPSASPAASPASS